MKRWRAGSGRGEGGVISERDIARESRILNVPRDRTPRQYILSLQNESPKSDSNPASAIVIRVVFASWNFKRDAKRAASRSSWLGARDDVLLLHVPRKKKKKKKKEKKPGKGKASSITLRGTKRFPARDWRWEIPEEEATEIQKGRVNARPSVELNAT